MLQQSLLLVVLQLLQVYSFVPLSPGQQFDLFRKRSVERFAKSEGLKVGEARRVDCETSFKNPVCGPYSDGRQLVLSEVNIDKESLDEDGRGQIQNVAYMRAGPYERISLDPRSSTAAIITCGGLCPGLNTVVQELYRTLVEQYGCKRVFGIPGGYGGLEGNDFVAMESISHPALYREAGTVLGTSRGQRSAQDMVKNLKEHNVDILFVIGGDGTLRGAKSICKEATASQYILRVVAIPKTIDNDIPIIDKSFGFDTAVEAARSAIFAASIEARAFPRGLGLVRLMGRDAGFLAVHAALASPGDVDACLIKESGFDLDKLLEYLEFKLDTQGSALLVVAEGIGNKLQPHVDIGPWLADKFNKNLSIENGGKGFTLKYVDPGYAVRAIPPNAADTILCSRLAANAVHAAMAGYTDCAVATLNAQYAIIPLNDLVSRTSILAVNGHLWAELTRSTGQPDLHLSPRSTSENKDDKTEEIKRPSSFGETQQEDELATDLICDNDDGAFRESPAGGCVVSYSNDNLQ